MKKTTKKPLPVRAETIRILDDLREVVGGRKQSDDPCWTTRDSKGLPCTNEPTSTQTCPLPSTVPG